MAAPPVAAVPRVSSICSECGAPVTFDLGALQVRCEHCAAGLALDQGLRTVRLSCPRCGGNFCYIDGALCGRCPFCDAALLALSRDRLLRYVVLPAADPPHDAGAAELLLLPFWHLAGLLYGWDVGARVELVEEQPYQESSHGEPDPLPRTTRRDSGPQKRFRGRVIDLSAPDPVTQALGVTSLRLRGAVFPLEPFAAAHEELGRLVPAALDLAQARELLTGRALGRAEASDGLTRLDLRRQDLVAETLSLRYYPFWVRRGGEPAIWDAVSGQAEPLSPAAVEPSHGASAAFDELRVIELACGACGATLPGGNRSLVLPCACGRFWRAGRDRLEPFTARWARPLRPAERLLWLPFWRLDVTVSYRGREASRVADLRQGLGVLPPPAELPTAPPDDPLGFFAPAYGALRAPRLDFAARDLTRRQPLLEPGAPGAGETFNCFLGPEDARRLAYVTWIGLLPGTVVQGLRSLRVQTGEAADLWYLPFADHGRELECLLTGLRYDRTAFRGLRH